jgi:hypothetical protein
LIAESAARPAAATQSLGFLKHEDHEVDTKSTKKKEEESQRAQRGRWPQPNDPVVIVLVLEE